MAEDKTFRYGFIMLGFFLVMTGMFIMSVEKPQIYITFCALGVLLIAVGITWSMCQCYPKITFIPVNLEAEQFLDHKSIVLPEGDTCLIAACPKQEATSTYEQSLPSYEQTQGQALGSAPLPPTAHPRPRRCSQPAVQAKAEVHRELGGAGDPPQELAPRLEEAEGSCSPWTAPGAAPLASLLEDMDTPSLGGSVPSSPVPRGRHPPSAARSGCTLTSSPARGEHPSSSHEGAGEEDDFYYGLQEGLDSLLEDSDCLFEPEN
ncbi:barttin [Falco rusticolus]|uniref:barttin n=1 Tax=Falco cherrug TaxID=345164 RepID=UPI000FFBE0CC|nr:barttin [Falco cherrug]XP_037259409.1 barttin [Falco rusticolus]